MLTLAVKVTESPAQSGLSDATIATEGTTIGFTVICTFALVAFSGEGHCALEVMRHQTESLFTITELAKVLVEPD